MAPQVSGRDQDRADCLVNTASLYRMPLITVAMPRRIWVPNAEWMAFDALHDWLYRRAKTTSDGHHHPCPPAVEKCTR